MRRLFNSTIVVTACAIVGACGGGSGGGTPNIAPSLASIVDQFVDEGVNLSFTVSATDADGPSPLALKITGSSPALPAGAVFTDQGNGIGNFDWTPLPVDAGTYRVTVTATDGAGLTDSRTTMITVNHRPTINPIGDRTVTEDDPLVFQVTASDPDGPAPLAMSIKSSAPSLPSAATFTDNSDGIALFNWTPSSADVGSYTVTFAATEDSGNGKTGEAVVVITVTANPPVFSDDFSDGNANGWVPVNNTVRPSNWTVINQELRQLEEQGKYEAVGGLDSIYHLGTYVFQQDNFALTDFRFSANIQLLSEFGDECGVMWRYQDNNNYYRLTFSWRDSFTLLQRKTGGVWKTLAKNVRGLRAGQRAGLAITTQGPLARIELDGVRLFAVRDTALASGTIGLYTQNDCAFDDVSVKSVSPGPSVAIAHPVEFSVSGSTDVAVAAVVVNRPSTPAVIFSLDGMPCNGTVETAPGFFETTCSAAQPGTYALSAELTDQGILTDVDNHDTVGLGGDNYAGIGDSTTNGSPFDNYQRDGTTSPGWVVSSQGYNANLTDGLNAVDPTRPHIVSDVSVPGDRSIHVLNRLVGSLEQSADATTMLLLVGTNDAVDGRPSGLNCVGAACDNTLFRIVQTIIDDTIASGKDITVSLSLPIFGTSRTALFANPDSQAINALIRDYNEVIRTQLTGHSIGPDLYDYFLGQANRATLFEDHLHPNGLGVAVLGALWKNALTGSTTLPFVVNDITLRLSQGGAPVIPLLYKQNLLEAGDRFFFDSTATLVSVPPVLQDGVWIMTTNANVNATNSDHLSVDVGTSPVDVYVAFDGGATQPGWLGAGFVDTGFDVTTNHPNAPTMNVFRKTNQTGTVVLGGADGSNTGANANYVVIIVP